MVAVAVAAAAAAAADAVVVGDVECCGGGVDARVRCADRERRDEDEEDDDAEEDVEEVGDAAAADRHLEETGLLEREFLRAAAELGLSSAGVSGGRAGWAGSGAVAAAAAATMPCRCRGRWGGRSGYARRLRSNAGPRGSRFAAPAPAPAPAPARASAPAGGGGRPPDRRACEDEGEPQRTGEAVLQFEAEERQGRSEVGDFARLFLSFFFNCFTRFCILLWVWGSLLVLLILLALRGCVGVASHPPVWP